MVPLWKPVVLCLTLEVLRLFLINLLNRYGTLTIARSSLYSDSLFGVYSHTMSNAMSAADYAAGRFIEQRIITVGLWPWRITLVSNGKEVFIHDQP